jgi:3-oxoacyl-[acyl-carrier protein] reductase
MPTNTQGNKENRSIVNVSSTSGLHGNVGQANYAAAKAAVIGLTKTIAKEWGPFGVRANTIAFGLVHTRSVFRAVAEQYHT